MATKTKAGFIQPMLLQRTERLPEGPDWLYELKLKVIEPSPIKTAGKLHLRSRNDNDFTVRYPTIVKALAPLPDLAVIGGELVALDASGRPSFNALQSFVSTGTTLIAAEKKERTVVHVAGTIDLASLQEVVKSTIAYDLSTAGAREGGH